jgi:hypothetical protein
MNEDNCVLLIRTVQVSPIRNLFSSAKDILGDLTLIFPVPVVLPIPVPVVLPTPVVVVPVVSSTDEAPKKKMVVKKKVVVA